MPRMKIFCAAAAALSVAAIVGCGGDSNPTTHPVSGTVTQGGSPVADATVTFVASGSGKSAVGKTDSSGKYQLTTFESNDGAVPGDYKIRVAKFDRPQDVEADAPSSETVDDSGLVEMPADYEGAEEGPAGEPKNLLPEKYNNTSNTPLQYTVTEGENTYDIELDAS